MHSLSMDRRTFEIFKDRKLARFREFFMLDSIVEQCTAWTKPRTRESRPNPGLLLRIVVPFHPGLRDLGRSLKTVCSEWSSLLARVWQSQGDPFEGNFVDIQVSYKSAGPALSEVCRRQTIGRR